MHDRKIRHVPKLNSHFTPARTHSISGLKSRLKIDGEKWSRIFYFEIHRAPAKLPGQFSHSEQIFLHWAGATLEGLGEF